MTIVFSEVESKRLKTLDPQFGRCIILIRAYINRTSDDLLNLGCKKNCSPSSVFRSNTNEQSVLTDLRLLKYKDQIYNVNRKEYIHMLFPLIEKNKR